MSAFYRELSVLLISVPLLAVSGGRAAVADKIGGSALPVPGPALKGRIAEADGATSVIVLSTAVGATTNAGPTFAEQVRAFVDRGLGYAQATASAFGRLDLSFTVADRSYVAFTDANERSGQASVSLTRDWGGQETILAFATSAGRDIEERLAQVSLGLTHAWTSGRVRPYAQAETVLLDYHDMPGELLAFSNQDDRDRISSRVQAGLSLTISEHVEIEMGGGVDTKGYFASYDDFGVARDSVSLFPLIGLALTAKGGEFRAVYMPFRRSFKEALFDDMWVHGYAVDGGMRFSDTLSAFASVRHGFEETDFLVASAAYETVAVGGLVLTYGWGSFTLAASETRRGYGGLGLIGIQRADRKRELVLSGEIPLFDTISLAGRISYMDFETSLGDAGTDVLTVSLGLTHVLTQ